MSEKTNKPEKKIANPTPELIRHGEVRNGRLIRYYGKKSANTLQIEQRYGFAPTEQTDKGKNPRKLRLTFEDFFLLFYCKFIR